MSVTSPQLLQKIPEIKKNVVWTLVALACFLAIRMMPYLEGRSNSWWLIPPMIPADFLPILLLLVCCVRLLASAIRSFFAKRHRVAKILFFLFSLLLLGGITPPEERFHRGFSQYARTVLTAEEWRQISRYAQEHMKPERENGSRDKIAALNEGLESNTPLGKLTPHPRIFVNSDSTGICWGGPLTGHRGVVIFTRPDGRLPEDAVGGTFIFEDITTFVSPD